MLFSPFSSGGDATMEKRQLGKTDMHVTVLGFGGAEIGFERAEAGTVAQLLNSALDAGLNVIDTAECYMQSEELIGQAVAGRRKDYYLSTNGGHPETMSSPDCRPPAVLASAQRGLEALRAYR